MPHLLNQTAAHKLTRSLKMRLGATAINALNQRIEAIIKESALKASIDKRKTILERDVVQERDLFS